MTATRRVAVGSRTSPLSLVQTEEVLGPLRAMNPKIDFVIVPIVTHGDHNKNAPLLSMDRGMFAKEIEESLLKGEIDIAVHSAKDLEATLPKGLVLGAFSQRKDPRDVLMNRWSLPLSDLPEGARLGTSSPRRTAQIKANRANIEILPIRGNVGTRLNKANGVGYDGVVLAAAGMLRLGLQGRITEYLSPQICTPEPGQGALAVEAREDSLDILEMLAEVDHTPTNAAVTAERAFLETIGGGCKIPVAAHATYTEDNLHISTMAAISDGSLIFRTNVNYDASDPVAAGRSAAQALMNTGASEIVQGDRDI